MLNTGKLKQVKKWAMIKIVEGLLWFFPVKKNRIYMSAYQGKSYGCNPKAITEYLVKNHKSEFEIIWEAIDKEVATTIPSELKKVKPNTIRSYFYYCTAKFIINNERSPIELGKRNNQIYIQTWHGGLPLKKIEKDAEKHLSRSYIKKAKADSKKIDYLLSAGKLYTQIKRNCFWFDGKIVETGLPRNDILFQMKEDEVKKQKEAYGAGGKKIALYAPTFRNNKSIKDYQLDDQKLCEELGKKFGGEWIVFYKLHPNMLKYESDLTTSSFAKIVPIKQDIQELLCIADCVFTDFSSLMFDVMLLKKPCFLYLNDSQQYLEQERGLYFELDQLPFPAGETQENVFHLISNFDYDHYREEVEKFIDRIGSVDDGNACERVYQLIKKCQQRK